MNNEDKILEAALSVINKKTISGTRMHLISDELDMVQSNMHYYFKTKNDLLIALYKKVLNKCLEIRRDLRKTSVDTLESQIDIFILQKKELILHYKEYDFAEIEYWIQGRINEDIRERFAKSFCEWRDEVSTILCKYAPDLSEDKKKYLPYIIVSLLEGATLQYLIDEGNFDISEYCVFSKNVIMDCIGSAKREV